MRIIGNRGVRLPDYKEHVLSKGIETPDLPDRLYIPVPEELLTELQPGEGFRRGQFLWENEYHLPVYCPADGVVEDVVRLSHPLFGDGCYLLLSELKRVRGNIPLPKNTPPELAEKARCAAILDEVDEVPLRERAGEYLMLRLRTITGINRYEYEHKFLLPFDEIEAALERSRTMGYAMRSEEGRWRLTPRGFLISNDIITDLLLIQDKSQQMQRFR